MSALALALATLLGPWGFGATVVAVICAWAYSLEPIRLKRSGWLGPGLVGLCYEGLPWFTGAAVLVAGAPSWPIVLVALLYALGAHGIMTLNDFKALAGDRATGVNSLPVTLGPERAARLACVVMAVPQVAVILALAAWDRPIHAAAILALLLLHSLAPRLPRRRPQRTSRRYRATGVTLYVAGMMVAACYEGLPWFTGAAVMTAALPDWRIILIAALYSFGAHGIMTLNDFKSIEGDKRMGVRSLPVQLGAANAALLACVVMAVPQVVVAGLLLSWGRPWHCSGRQPRFP
jgi:4-hydroxybenzoate polyprenyltransferase